MLCIYYKCGNCGLKFHLCTSFYCFCKLWNLSEWSRHNEFLTKRVCVLTKEGARIFCCASCDWRSVRAVFVNEIGWQQFSSHLTPLGPCRNVSSIRHYGRTSKCLYFPWQAIIFMFWGNIYVWELQTWTRFWHIKRANAKTKQKAAMNCLLVFLWICDMMRFAEA